MARKKHQAKKTATALTLASQILNRGGRVVLVNLLDPGEEAAAELRRRLQALGVNPDTCDGQVAVIDGLDFAATAGGWVAGGEAPGAVIVVDAEPDITAGLYPEQY